VCDKLVISLAALYCVIFTYLLGAISRGSLYLILRITYWIVYP
jgi:hypothetical protein